MKTGFKMDWGLEYYILNEMSLYVMYGFEDVCFVVCMLPWWNGQNREDGIM